MKTLLNAIKSVVKTSVQVVKDSIRIVVEVVFGTVLLGSFIASAPIPLLGVVVNMSTNTCVGLWIVCAIIAALYFGLTFISIGLHIAMFFVIVNLIKSVFKFCKNSEERLSWVS